MAKVKVKFEGIDSWNRPVFRNVDGVSRYGCVDILFHYDVTEEAVLQLINEKDLLWFGNSFDCEPMGNSCNVEIIR